MTLDVAFGSWRLDRGVWIAMLRRQGDHAEEGFERGGTEEGSGDRVPPRRARRDSGAHSRLDGDPSGSPRRGSGRVAASDHSSRGGDAGSGPSRGTPERAAGRALRDGSGLCDGGRTQQRRKRHPTASPRGSRFLGGSGPARRCPVPLPTDGGHVLLARGVLGLPLERGARVSGPQPRFLPGPAKRRSVLERRDRLRRRDASRGRQAPHGCHLRGGRGRGCGRNAGRCRRRLPFVQR